ncbi:PREDICTED: cytochrome P450 734A1-like [Nelumbo nucifera]|uniref:Cytochrome P450 734A1-like n=2 Tax=Nelumbo nucifera TaxID=4432 RepID=A0A1U7ZU44_NELNU|nr:PREDICTED: cytochrome P450 734A1-like [Nelumbo nucifera]DAD18903.1 TPA_asm: hypothetical protein HUJ06_020366 [Nelumbo nucifera]
MEPLYQLLIKPLSLAMTILLSFVLWKAFFICWVLPTRAYNKLRKSGFGGPIPCFPLGNIREMTMTKKKIRSSSPSLEYISHDIYPIIFPYFSQWRELHGKVFVYWLGIEPFLYIADPEFLTQMSSGVIGKKWGKPNVFKQDRKPLFGNGLLMVEGDNWVHHRHTITPVFLPNNLKAMGSMMVESATKMIDRWTSLIASGEPEIYVEKDIMRTYSEIIARAAFGVDYRISQEVFTKLRAMHLTLFKSNRLVGVPFNNIVYLKQTIELIKLSKDVDQLLLSMITNRKMSVVDVDHPQHDLLGFLLEEKSAGDGQLGKKFSDQELIDECKTFFFAGHETTALALTWTLFLLALHPEWQNQLREEIKQVVGDRPLDPTMVAQLKKMGWVMNEVLRLYPAGPNSQRQAREDIRVGNFVIPNGTNMWIDIVGMNHDPVLWGDDVNEFRPERFKGDINGGCKYKMGFVPFGFGGRMCVGRNLAMMEYKIVLTLILTSFSFSLSPTYHHSPTIMLSLRPAHGLPLILEQLV